MNLEQFPTSETAKKMLGYITGNGFYDNSYVGKWIFQVMGEEMDDARAIIDELPLQAFVETATWGLRYHEEKYGLPIRENLSPDERRKIILEKRDLKAPMSPWRMEKIISGILGCTVDVVDINEPGSKISHPNMFIVYLEGEGEFSLGKAVEKLDEVKQSHTFYELRVRIARRVLSVGNGNIRGYAAPKYDSQGTAPSNPPAGGNSGNSGSGTDLNRTPQWTGTVNTGSLNVRTWAGTENANLKSYPTISQGTKVGVCDTVKDKDGDPWYYVKISGSQGDKYGFVSAAYITKQSTSKPSGDTTLKDDGVITKTPQWTGKVTADVLNVRSWAGTNNPLIKSWPKLSMGNLVDVCDVVNAADGSRWYYIRIDGRIYGFVHSTYIAKA